VKPTIKVHYAALADRSVALPRYESAGAAGADLRANFPPDQRETGVCLAPFARCLVPTGLHLEIPPGHEAQIRARSGLALKHGVTLANAPGTIDGDYRGEIGIILINLGDRDFTVCHGDRIAQMVLARVTRAVINAADELTATNRGQGGFGSTGVG